MKKNVLRLTLILLNLVQDSFGQSIDFVLIKGAVFQPGIGENQDDPAVHMEDFEMLTHAFTNAEYEQFVEATHHRVPLYWKEGNIPDGK